MSEQKFIFECHVRSESGKISLYEARSITNSASTNKFLNNLKRILPASSYQFQLHLYSAYINQPDAINSFEGCSTVCIKSNSRR